MDERQAIESHYKSNRARVYRTIGKFISDAATIEDLTHHKFLHNWVKRETIQGNNSYSTWMTSVATHTALAHLQESRATNIDPDLQEMNRILDAVNTLPDDLRIPLVLVVIYGQAYSDVALVLDIPEGIVRLRVYKGRYALKDLLR